MPAPNTAAEIGRDGLLALAARVEAATGADREIDAAISKALDPFCVSVVGGAIYSENGSFGGTVPAWTSDLSAALSLVPAGLGVSVSRHGKRGDDCEAYVGKSDSDARGNFMTHTKLVSAKTMSLALTAAALKARAVGEGVSGEE